MPTRTNTAKWMENQKRWQINVQKDGVRRSFTSSTPGRKGQREANAKADAWLEKSLNGINSRIEDIYPEFLESVKLVSKNEYLSAISRGKNYILPAIGRKQIGKLTEQDLQAILDKAYAENQLARKTLSNLRNTIQSFLKFCRKKRYTALRPEDLSIPKNARAGTRHILQPEHIAILFSSEETVLNRKRRTDCYINAYRFSVLFGLRPGEAVGLQWKDIEGDTVHIRRAINNRGELTEGKNENAIRQFALNELGKSILQDQRTRFYNGPYVFSIPNQTTYLKRWSRYCESNGIPHISLYEMRHTFVSVAKRLPEGLLRPMVGHSKNMDTFGVYSHQMDGELQEASKLVQEEFRQILSKK